VDLFLRSLLFLLHSPLFCSGNFSLHKKRLSIAAYIQILHPKVFFPPAAFSLFLHVYAIFAMFLGVFSQLFLSQGYAIPLYGMIFLNTESATLCRFRQAEQK
jgi:hypothetical protein